jgi:hypothetical protein
MFFKNKNPLQRRGFKKLLFYDQKPFLPGGTCLSPFSVEASFRAS